jgi:putative inorganic carbon (HCO3(-)) transporter
MESSKFIFIAVLVLFLIIVPFFLVESSKFIFIAISAVLFIFIPFFLKDIRRYYLGFASFLYVFTSGYIFYDYTGLMLADLPIIGLFITSLFSRRRIRFFWPMISIPMLGIILFGLLSAMRAIQPGWALAETSKYVRMYLLIVCLVHNIRDLKDLRFVTNWMLVGLLIEAFIGIYQWQFGALGIWFLGERPAARVDWRTFGTFYVPAFYANYLTMTLSIALRMFVFYKAPKTITMIFSGAASALGLLALFTTYARGPWIGFSIAMIIVFGISLLWPKFRIQSQWALPVLFIFLAFFLFKYHSQILDQFGSGRRASYESRFPQYRIARRMIIDKPLQGVGMGNYILNSRNYMNPEEKSSNLAGIYAWMVHNSYLLITAETGLPGGIVFITWFICILAIIAKILKNRMNHPYIINLTLGILGGMISVIIFLISGPDIHEYSLLYQISLFCGILLAERNILKQAEMKQKRKLMSERGTPPIPSVRSQP